MRILATLPNGMLNLSVHEMMEATALYGQKCVGENFTLDIEMHTFWEIENPEYDLIHIHWIEALLDWAIPTLEQIQRLEKRLIELRKQGKKIIITRHNSLPHRRAEHDALLYETGYKYADAIFHMEEYSYGEYLSWYQDKTWLKQQTHHFAPIILFTKLPNKVPKVKARQQLGIPKDAFVFMVLGSIRTKDERNLLEQIARTLQHKNDILYVAQWPFYGKRFLLKECRQWMTRFKFPRHRFIPAQAIADDNMQVYLNASDVLISPRMDSLNSGLVSLGFSFGRTVLGPSVGNMQNILSQTGNPMYDPKHLDQLKESLEQAKELAKSGKGAENLAFAKAEWSWEKVGKNHVEAYLQIYENQDRKEV
ncbi:MAG: hypothetical protein MK212_03020 [Saprospiraceae bacterium]|nr:hypothetical protein [Saprospiraceae bacterium]